MFFAKNAKHFNFRQVSFKYEIVQLTYSPKDGDKWIHSCQRIDKSWIHVQRS